MIAETLTGLAGVLILLVALYHVLNEVINEKPLIAFVSLGTFTFTLLLTFLGFVIFQTLYPFELPLKVHAHYGTAVPHDNGTLFRYSRSFDVDRDFEAQLYRRIDCVVGDRTHSFDLPQLSRDYHLGTYAKIDRYVMYPVALPVGTICDMHTTVTWRPRFSLGARLSELPLFVFTVAPYDVGDLPATPMAVAPSDASE